MTTRTPPEPERRAVYVSGRRLSLLDFGGPGRPLPALHGHFADGRTFARLAGELGDAVRVVALDQRRPLGDWPAGACPALLVRGSRSTVLSAEHARSMAARRPRTRRVELPAGHSVHETVPVEFAGSVRGFLGPL
ncbi:MULTISPECIES: alpha/beta fold hydrolase [unclassified Streptomyces]|uniref:alpha/beta fold hydrolase n=1 Tax=unclassified Streptomyces TaxID=2593676 RepID=UPI000CD4A67B|nr:MULTISPECIES: alpha/beta hydrolase [unclassified Streptomyces]